MNGRKALPITTVLLILALALATVGVGYGLWSKVLTIEGTVHTGEVNAVLSIEEIDEGDAALVGDNGIDEDNEIEDKDVADCAAVLISQSPPDIDNEGPQLMRITVNNGYPSFSCFVNFNVQNLGTIPIKVDQPVLIGVDTKALDVEFIKGSIGAGGCYYDEVDPGVPVGLVDPHPQLEPEQMTFCTIWVHVKQAAAMDTTYTFETKIVAHQWNEFSGPHDPLYP
jgi:hypothetical protein